MKRIKKQILSLFLAVVMLAPLAPLSASAADNTITIDGTVQYSKAFELLDSINEIRAQKGRTPFVMDQGMLDAAVIRSAELAVRYHLYRPNGDFFYTAYPQQGGYDASEIYIYYKSTGDSVEQWLRSYKDNEPYVLSREHRSVGISIFTHDDKDYVLVFFSILDGTPAQQPEDRTITQEIHLGESVYTVTLEGKSTMDAGAQQTLTVRQKTADTKKSLFAIWNNDSLSWTSSNPAVATVHDGVVTALSAGTAEITAQAGNNTASIPVTVEGEAAHVHTLQYIDRVEPTYYENGREAYWLCTVCDHMYREEEAVNEVTLEALVIPQLVCSEHLWDGGTVTRAAASTREGNLLYVCVNCSAERNDPIPVNGKIAMHSGDLHAAKPTVAQLNTRFNSLTTSTNRYVEEPSVAAPYKAGKLTDEFLTSGEIYLNYIRYMAGLPDVKLDEKWCENAQYGAAVLGAINELTHYPSRPADMNKDFFQEGYAATSSSNISITSGSNPILSSILSCMNDCLSLDNLTGVGHRRWLLNPEMTKVGFGTAKSVQGNQFVTTKVFAQGETTRPMIDYDFISWPASGNMGSNVFDPRVPWSITLNPEIYNNPVREQIKITLTRAEGNTVWSFDKNTAGPSTNENQYLSLDDWTPGGSNYIIFSPGSNNIDEYAGTYLVSVEGLTYKDGSPASLYYEVAFTKLTKCVHTNTEVIPAVAATCNAAGLTEGSRCKDCGAVLAEQTVIPATGEHADAEVDGKCDVCGEELSKKLWGDTDNSGEVNVRDAVMLLMAANGRDVAIDRTLADVTGDGRIMVNDAVWVLKRANGSPDLFPAEK